MAKVCVPIIVVPVSLYPFVYIQTFTFPLICWTKVEMYQVRCFDFCEIRMMYSGYPVSHWDLKVTEMPRFIKWSWFFSCCWQKRSWGACWARVRGPVALKGNHWLGCLRKGLTSMGRICSHLRGSPAELLRSHTPVLCERQTSPALGSTGAWGLQQLRVYKGLGLQAEGGHNGCL